MTERSILMNVVSNAFEEWKKGQDLVIYYIHLLTQFEKKNEYKMCLYEYKATNRKYIDGTMLYKEYFLGQRKKSLAKRLDNG